jgi:hypothetical protein
MMMLARVGPSGEPFATPSICLKSSLFIEKGDLVLLYLINAFTPNPKRSNNIPHVDLKERATPDNLPKIWVRLPFIGKYGNILTKRFINKTRRVNLF